MTQQQVDGAFTPQCNCVDPTRFTGQCCEVETPCAAQPAMQRCATPDGMPMLNTTTNACQCSCQGSWQNTNCQTCGLRCLNNGVDFSKCMGNTCTCSSTGNTLYYGQQCECKGLILKSTLPLSSEKFDFIRNKRAEIAVLVEEATEALQGNDMLSFLKKDAFTMFLQSFLQHMLSDYRNTLVINGVNTASLYDYNANTKQYTITKKNISNIVRLVDFETMVRTFPGSTGSDEGTELAVEMTLLLIALPRCYDNSAVVIDDTNWSTTLQHMSAVVEYLVGQDIDVARPSGEEDEKTNNPLVNVYDPLCETKTCMEKPNDENESSNNHNNSALYYGTTTQFASLVLVTFVVVVGLF